MSSRLRRWISPSTMEKVPGEYGWFDLLANHLHVHLDGRERVPDFVSQAKGKMPDCSNLFGHEQFIERRLDSGLSLLESPGMQPDLCHEKSVPVEEQPEHECRTGRIATRRVVEMACCRCRKEERRASASLSGVATPSVQRRFSILTG